MEINEEPVSEPSSGNDAQFEAFFKEFYGSLVGFFINRGLAKGDAEDLAQETMLRAFRFFDLFRGDSSRATWIFKIAWNVWKNSIRARNTLRRRGESVSIESELENESVGGQEDVPTELFDRQLRDLLASERHGIVREAIQRLPRRMGECLTYYVYSGFSYRDIARMLNVQLNTVKSTISQAKSKLQDDLRSRYPEFFDEVEET